MTLKELQGELCRAAQPLVDCIFDELAPALISGRDDGSERKIINDPIWKIIELTPLEVAVLDTPLMQRLRGVRQLGLAHLVYPGAHHSRLEHSIGAMHAARLMFRRLVSEVMPITSGANHLETIVAMAALLHDCGHVVFSHAGEVLLKDKYLSEFTEVATVLNNAFGDPAILVAPEKYNEAIAGRPAKWGPAELLSVLFVLSPSSEKFFLAGNFDGLCLSGEDLLTVGALILGRPYGLKREGKYLHFAKSIVSGDLDADKIDYVARDGFYAGIPTASDVHRLLSQLCTVCARQGVEQDDLVLPFAENDVDEFYLFGVQLSGMSAVEMFVTTRAYRFERIYLHQKVRAAETLLTRALRLWHDEEALTTGRGLNYFLKILFDAGGDDAVLSKIASRVANTEANDAAITQRTDAAAGTAAYFAQLLQVRNLPRRACALWKGISKNGDATIGTARNVDTEWSRFTGDMSETSKRVDFVSAIEKLSNTKGDSDFFLDWAPRKPVEENPELWVNDPETPGKAGRAKHYLNIEQQANAYQGVKRIDWIFAYPEFRSRVAAAAAVEMHNEYGLIPTKDALGKAKIKISDYTNALGDIDRDDKNNQYSQSIAAVDVTTAAETTHFAHWKAWSAACPARWEQSVRKKCGQILATGITDAGLPTAHAKDLDIAVPALKLILKHADANYRNLDLGKIAGSAGKKLEAAFADDLVEFLNQDQEFTQVFSNAREVFQGEGFVDILLIPKDSSYRNVIVELKAVRQSYESITSANAGQPLQYITVKDSCVAILYAYFEQNDNLQIDDALQVWKAESEGSPLVAIAVGVKGKGESPSKLGKSATKSKTT